MRTKDIINQIKTFFNKVAEWILKNKNLLGRLWNMEWQVKYRQTILTKM